MAAWRRRSFAALGLAAASLAACNLITGLSDDYTLDGGTEGGATADAATELPAADGSTATDGGPGVDADADADADTGPPGPFCPDAGDAGIVFCTEFDEAAPFAGWYKQEEKGGTLSVVADAGQDGSRALRVFAADAETDRTVALWRIISGAAPGKAYKQYSVTFDFLVRKNDLEYGVFATLMFPQPGGAEVPEYGLAAYFGTMLDQSDPPAQSSPPTGDGKFNVWHTGKVTLDRIGTSTVYEGTIAVDETVVDVLRNIDTHAAQRAELRLGYLFTSSNSGETEVLFDRVIVRTTP